MTRLQLFFLRNIFNEKLVDVVLENHIFFCSLFERKKKTKLTMRSGFANKAGEVF